MTALEQLFLSLAQAEGLLTTTRRQAQRAPATSPAKRQQRPPARRTGRRAVTPRAELLEPRVLDELLMLACAGCGCTDDHACADGCSWETPTLCTRSSASMTGIAIGRPPVSNWMSSTTAPAIGEAIATAREASAAPSLRAKSQPATPAHACPPLPAQSDETAAQEDDEDEQPCAHDGSPGGTVGRGEDAEGAP